MSIVEDMNKFSQLTALKKCSNISVSEKWDLNYCI